MRTCSAEMEMTVNILIQIDKLVQLLESPVFTCKWLRQIYSNMIAGLIFFLLI